MSGRLDTQGAIEAVNLAEVADFQLGTLRVQPSRRRVSADEHEEFVEPRVMQALIALVEADGAVVSRDTLIDRCWSGRIVGEDAINRCIAKVRRLAEIAEPAAFSIETVSKVGYRLQVPGAGKEIASASPPTRGVAPERGGRWRIGWREAAIAAFIAIVALAVSVVTWRPAAPLARAPVSVAAAPYNPPPHSVAVLAFANLSDDPTQEYLSDGLAEALIDVLSRVDQLRVTARTSSFTFKGHAATIEEIGRKLNVGAVLEGSLRRQGTHLRVDAHLSDARTGYTLWSQSYDRQTADMLTLQDEIAGDVAEALRVKLVDMDNAGRSPGGTVNPLAFDAYLRGEQHVRAMAEGAQAALAEFRTAIALDPNFALAQSRLAFVLVMISQSSAKDGKSRDMMAEARRAAERAIALAPGLGMAHSNLAMVLRNEVTDMDAAWIEAGRARELAPGNAIVETQYAQIASIVGQGDEAIRAANHAAELDPLRAESWSVLGDVFECARKYDAARDATRRSMTLTSHPQWSALDELGTLALEQGKMDDARRICAAIPDHGCMAIADHALGRQVEADKDMAAYLSLLGESGAYNFSEIYAQWHEPELARRWLTKAREINDPALSWIKCDTFQDPMRSQPWFAEIENSLHFPPQE